MKRPFLIGAVIGGILGVAVCLGMDAILGQNPGGGWKDAVAYDLGRLFNMTFSTDSPLVTLGVVIVIGIFAAIGGLLGGYFSRIVFGIFDRLNGEE